MPRKRSVTEERVVDAAFQLLRRRGFAAVSARAVAEELGSSTMPIYSSFRSMDRLVSRLRERALDVLVEHQAARSTGDVFVDLALGYVRFAREEPHLFRFYFVEQGESLSSTEQERMRERVFERLGLDSPPDSPLSSLPRATQDAIAFKTWVFVHGIAVLVNGGVLDDPRDERILALITAAGHAFADWEIAHGDRTRSAGASDPAAKPRKTRSPRGRPARS